MPAFRLRSARDASRPSLSRCSRGGRHAGAAPAAAARAGRAVQPGGRQLEPRCAALLPAADRRDRAAQRRAGHGLPAAARRGARARTTKACSAARPRSRCRRAPATRRWPRVIAWRKALPESVDALRYEVQLLIALNRTPRWPSRSHAAAPDAASRPLRAMLDAAAALPRAQHRQARRVARAGRTGRCSRTPTHRTPAPPRCVAIGRGWLAAGDNAQGARRWPARRGRRRRAADGPALLALEMLPATPAAEAIVTARLALPAVQPERAPGLRAHARARRSASPRRPRSSSALTASDPKTAPPWLTLGALQLELQQPKEADRGARRRYVAPGRRRRAGHFGAAPVCSRGRRRRRHAATTANSALTQAWLLLAQAAEQQGDCRPPSAGSPRSTTRSARSTCRRGAPRCWRAGQGRARRAS